MTSFFILHSNFLDFCFKETNDHKAQQKLPPEGYFNRPDNILSSPYMQCPYLTEGPGIGRVTASTTACQKRETSYSQWITNTSERLFIVSQRHGSMHWSLRLEALSTVQEEVWALWTHFWFSPIPSPWADKDRQFPWGCPIWAPN